MASYNDIEQSRSGKPSLARRGLAALILAVAGILVLHFVVHLILAVFWIALVVAVIGGLLWAANQLL